MLKKIINFFLIFALIYNISFDAFPSFTSGRIAFIFLIISNFKDLKLVFKEYKFLKLIILLLLLVSFLQFTFTGDNTQFSRFFYFTLFSLISSFILAIRVKDTQKLLFYILLAISFQSLVLIFTFFNPSFKLILDQYIVYSGNFTVENLYRSFGLSTQTGAVLSLTQSFGVGVGLLLLKYKNNYLIKSFIIISFLSTFFVGRTGILISLIFFGAYFYYTISFKKIIKVSLIMIILPFLITILSNKLTSSLDSISGFSSEFFLGWISEGFDIKDNRTVNALVSTQNIPELTIQNFFIGSGTISNSNGLNTSGHDSGYIQTYFSIGLIFTVLFYLSFSVFIVQNFKILNNRKLLFFICLIILVLEFKEPMLFKYTEGFIFLSVLFSMKYEKLNKINNR